MILSDFTCLVHLTRSAARALSLSFHSPPASLTFGFFPCSFCFYFAYMYVVVAAASAVSASALSLAQSSLTPRSLVVTSLLSCMEFFALCYFSA